MRSQRFTLEIGFGLALALAWLAWPESLRAQALSRAGVRADAMGGAFVAVSNDVSGLQYSAAGLLNARNKWMVQLARHQLFTGLEENIYLNNLGSVYNWATVDSGQTKLEPHFVMDQSATFLASPGPPPRAPDTTINRISLGAQWAGLKLPGSSQNTLMLSLGIGLFPRRNRSVDAGETTYVPNLISLAVSGRYLRYGYDNDYLLDPAYVNTAQELAAIESFLAAAEVNASDWALDASLFLHLSRKWQAAFSVQNLRQPNLASKPNDGSSKSTYGALAQRYRAGIAYQVRNNLQAALDVEKYEHAEGIIDDINLFAGAEYSCSNKILPFALRGGLNRSWLAGGFGLQLNRLIRQNLMFNWVYQLNLHGTDLNNVRFSFDYGWH